MYKRYFCLFVIIYLASSVLSCDSNSDAIVRIERPINEEIDSLLVTPVLSVEIRDNEQHRFGDIRLMEVDSEGRIFIFDQVMMHIKVFGVDGSLLDTFGRRGKGPGEFFLLKNFEIGKADTVWIYDPVQMIIHGYAPHPGSDWEYETSVRIPFTTSHDNHRKTSIPNRGKKVQGGFILMHEGVHDSVGSDYGYFSRVLSYMNQQGETISPDFFSLVKRFKKIERNGKNIRLGSTVLHPKLHIVTGNDSTIYIGRSDKLQLVEYNLKGDSTGTVQRYIDRYSIPEHIRDHWIDYGYYEEEIPAVYPAFGRFIIDDAGRFWFQMSRHSDTTQTWFALDRSEQLRGAFTLPKGIKVYEIKSDRIYGINRNGDLPIIQVYAIPPK